MSPLKCPVPWNVPVPFIVPYDDRLVSVASTTNVPAPMMVSPLVGLAIDRWGFDGVFLCVSLVLLIGWFQTFLLAEPRHASIEKPMPGRLNVES